MTGSRFIVLKYRYILNFLFACILFMPGCTTTYECECTRYKKYMTGTSTSVTVSKFKEKNVEAARKKCESASDSATSWNREEKLNCKLRLK